MEDVNKDKKMSNWQMLGHLVPSGLYKTLWIYITKTNEDDGISPSTFGQLEPVHSCEISENTIWIE